MINQNLLLTGDDGYNLTNSLRFRSSASAYLNRTPASAGDRKTWTFSAWIKRGTLGSVGTIIHCYDGSSSRRSVIQFNSDNTIGWDQGGSGTSGLIDTVAVYRDPSAWYHLVCVANYSNGTAANRALIYVNGVLQAVTTADDFDNDDGLINSTNAHQIGSQGGSGNFFDGYMTEVYLIDGQALTPSSFGETSATTGVWIPKKYTGTYGTNGFYLPFTDTTSTSTLGTDFSGNSNTWTVNNISLTAGTTYDSMTDVPTLTSATTANYCTLNAALQAGGYTLNDGNLNWARTGSSGGTNDRSQFGTIGVTSGKWYWEFTAGTVNSNSIPGFGIATGSASTQSWGGSQTGVYIYESDGLKYLSGTGSSYGASFTTGDIIGVAFDADAGTLTFYKNNTSQGQAASGLTSGPYFPAVTRTVGGGGSNGTEIANFGQRPFSYTPPTGFVALNTFNLPTPTIGATASTIANEYFDATLYTGNSTTNNIVNAGGMQPDFVWIKSRSNNQGNNLFDSVRGAGYVLFSNATNAETNNTANFTSFNSNGFSLASNGGDTNLSGYTYVGWQWRASNATAVTNTAGSITSTVSANTTAGFSIVTYTGNGTAGATIGHGLGVAPSMIIVKRRDNGSGGTNWFVYNKYLNNGTNPAQFYLILQSTSGQGGASNIWNDTAPTSTVFSVGTSVETNGSTGTFVAYCFTPIAGYSAFGSYTGNGSTDGTFVYTGFRPAFVLTKRTDSSGNWYLWDNKRIISANGDAGLLYPDSSIAESDYNASGIDLLSNGFKLRNTDSSENASGGTYIYMAFAESPFKYANAR